MNKLPGISYLVDGSIAWDCKNGLWKSTYYNGDGYFLIKHNGAMLQFYDLIRWRERNK